MEKNLSRYERGLATLSKMAGKNGEDAILPLGDLGKYIVEMAYGDIFNREGLSLRDREMITVTILTVLGREPQLKVHLNAAMNLGLTERELEEVMIQTTPYAGFPTAINAVNILKQVIEERN